jgi:hypothetical protein
VADKPTWAYRYRVDLRPDEIGAWRATLPEGYRFEATQALRQVLNRAVAWKIIDSNPAKNDSSAERGLVGTQPDRHPGEVV